jgi:diaminopimelate epimerase
MHFYKYQAGGNDFVLVDNRKPRRVFSQEEIGRICDRRFGIGADGLILIEEDAKADFRMNYFNSDGSQSLCGNGCRTAMHLATRLRMVKEKATFSAFDGTHNVEWMPDGRIRLEMAPVNKIERVEGDYYVNTGSPHVVRYVTGIQTFDVVGEGRKIRHGGRYAPGGTNVNFVEPQPEGSYFMRTYERGVEDETLSCGTGAVAVALTAAERHASSPVRIITRGGELTVEFANREPGAFESIFLSGPVKMVFEGDLDL